MAVPYQSGPQKCIIAFEKFFLFWVLMNIQKDWKAKLESVSSSFMLKYSEITVWIGQNVYKDAHNCQSEKHMTLMSLIVGCTQNIKIYPLFVCQKSNCKSFMSLPRKKSHLSTEVQIAFFNLGGGGWQQYSGVHKSPPPFFSKILEKPSIVQKKMIPHINGLGFSLI